MKVTIERHGRITEATVYLDVDVATYKRPADATQPGYLLGHGSTLRSKDDVADPYVGETIAVGRAFQDLGRKVEAIGHAGCVTKDEFERVNDLLVRRRARILDKQLAAPGAIQFDEPKSKPKTKKAARNSDPS
jgi:hypothetical protein